MIKLFIILSCVFIIKYYGVIILKRHLRLFDTEYPVEHGVATYFLLWGILWGSEGEFWVPPVTGIIEYAVQKANTSGKRKLLVLCWYLYLILVIMGAVYSEIRL